jgi:ABC-type transport system involved in multi-copper enzyme maturation permease subunit
VKSFIADGANPVLARELRGSLFGRKEQFVRALYVVTIATELLLIAFGRFDELLSLLPTLFRWYCVGNVVVILAVGAVLGALTFSMEREQRSLDLLLTTPLPPRQIVFGKLASVCYFTGYLVVASLPVVGFAFIMFVIPWYAALFVTVGFIVWGAWAAAVGVWCSLLFSRARQAVGAALGVVLLLVAGSALATGLTSIPYAWNLSNRWFSPDNSTLILFALLLPFQTNESLRHLAGAAWRFGNFNAAPYWLLMYTTVGFLAYAVCFVLLILLALWTFTRSVRRTQH